MGKIRVIQTRKGYDPYQFTQRQENVTQPHTAHHVIQVAGI